MRNFIKWGIVAALGAFAVTACTLATVDLTAVGKGEHGYTKHKHIAAPWRAVPPVMSDDVDTYRGPASCGDTPQGELCTFMESTTVTTKYRYSAAAVRGKWPIVVGLEYVCEREERAASMGYGVELDGEPVTDPLMLSRIPSDQTSQSKPAYETYVYYTLGGFTPDEGGITVSVDGQTHLGYKSIYGEGGKYIEITDELAIDGIRYAEASVELRIIRPGPNPSGDVRGSTLFEMDGAKSKFEAVDRLCQSS